MNNPGDVPAWPIWTVTGPFKTFTLSVDGHKISWNYSGFNGKDFENSTGKVRIDTRPDVQTAEVVPSGADRTVTLKDIDFTPIAPGAEVEVGITIDGTGFATCELRPQYLRAW